MHPLFLLVVEGGWGVNLLPNFKKERGLDRTLIVREGLVGKRGLIFLREAYNFYMKNKLIFSWLKKFKKIKGDLGGGG